MSNSFIKALLPALALARGLKDGTSYENASVLEGVDPSNNLSKLRTELQHWNEEVGGSYVLHGETVAWTTQSLAPYYSYGFCM